jgi:hypothetical protein
MRLMSSSFALLDDLFKINGYIEQNIQHRFNYEGNKMDKFGEEMLILDSYFQMLLSKNQHLFSNSEMHNYCQTVRLNFMKDRNEGDLTTILNSYKYYLHTMRNTA